MSRPRSPRRSAAASARRRPARRSAPPARASASTRPSARGGRGPARPPRRRPAPGPTARWWPGPPRTPPPPGPATRPAAAPAAPRQPAARVVPGIPGEGGQPVHRDQPAVLAGQQAHARGDLGRPGLQQRERKLAEHRSHHPPSRQADYLAGISSQIGREGRERHTVNADQPARITRPMAVCQESWTHWPGITECLVLVSLASLCSPHSNHHDLRTRAVRDR